MNPKIRRCGILLIVQFLILIPVFAQSSPQRVVNPNAHISWPLPIYFVRGQVQIHGTANLPGMTSYFVEYQPLSADGRSPLGGNNVWFPAVTPSQAPVDEAVLGVWDTTLVPDGIYALRLTVNADSGAQVNDVVSPLRVENHPLVLDTQLAPVSGATATAAPSFVTSPTPPPDSSAGTLGNVVVAVPSANVRTGDGTFFPIITALPQGTTAIILGLSSRGTGWYEVSLSDGRTGWISPATVRVNRPDTIGEHNIPFFTPPTLDPYNPVVLTATAGAFAYNVTLTAAANGTPVPTNASLITPVRLPNLLSDKAGGSSVCPPTVSCSAAQRAMIYCATPFNVGLEVVNNSSVPVGAGTVSVTDTRAADGSVQGTTSLSFSGIGAGAAQTLNTQITINTWYNEDHILTFVIDPNNQINESNESDNTITAQYTLLQGNCS